MDSYIVRIYRRIRQGKGEQIVGTVEDVSLSRTMKFQSIDELERALTQLPAPEKNIRKAIGSEHDCYENK